MLDSGRRSRPRAAVALLIIGATLVASSLAGLQASDSPAADVFGVSVGGDTPYENQVTLDRDLDAIAAMGAHWVRIDIAWSSIQDGGPSSYDWVPTDRLVQGITARGMAVLGDIAYTPEWARPPGTTDKYGADPAQYAAFAGTAAEHYSAMGVHAYEVWNEPNIQAFWHPKPDPVAYTNLLRAAYPQIHAADPEATVLSGGMSPAISNGTNYWPGDWLSAIYANGGRGYFDAVAHHPYCFPASPGEPANWSSWYVMNGSEQRFTYNGAQWGGPSLRETMIANGDADKKIWGTEFGAPTNGPDAISEEAQAAMIARGYEIWQSYEWTGPLLVYEARDLGTDTSDRENFFGLLRYDFTEKPALAAFRDAVDMAGSGGSGGGETPVATSTAFDLPGRGRKGPEDGLREITLRATVTGVDTGTGRIELEALRDGRWVPRAAKQEELGPAGRVHLDFLLHVSRTYRARAEYFGPGAPSSSSYRRFRLPRDKP